MSLPVAKSPTVVYFPDLHKQIKEGLSHMNAHKKAGYEKKLEDVSKPPNGTEEHYLALKRLLKDIEGDLYLTNFMSY